MPKYQSHLKLLNSTHDTLGIEQNEDNLIIFLSKKMADDLAHVPAVKMQNGLNQWVDIGDPANGSVPFGTNLAPNEYSLVDWKRHQLGNSLQDFQGDLPHIIREILRLLLYVEQGKEWNFPINPLNIIYDANEGRCRVFYRYPEPLKNVTGNWIDDVIKLLYYMCAPDINNTTAAFSNMDKNTFYSNFLYAPDQDHASDVFLNMVKQYSSKSIQDIATFAYNLTADADGVSNNHDIEYYLQKPVLEGADIISEVSDDHTQYIDDTRIPTANDASNLKYPDRKETPRKSKKKSNKGMIFLIIILIIGLLGGGYYWYSHRQPAEPQQTTQSSQKKSEPRDDSDFYNGLLDAAANNNDAGEDFDKYFSNGGSADNLSKSEIAAVFAAYLKDKKYNQILQNIGSEKTATALVKYLVSQNDTDAIKHLHNDNGYKIISFAKADANGNNQRMVSLADDVDLSDNQKYQDDLCKAFAVTNELKKGKNWASSQTNSSDLINAMKNYAYQQPNANKDQVNKKLGV